MNGQASRIRQIASGGVQSPGDSPDLILASASPARAAILARAGVVARIQAARIDETEIKTALRGEGAKPNQVAETLAELKARRVSQRAVGSLVIGADQLLVCDDAWFDKPANRAQAVADLRALRGKTHSLFTAVCVLRDGARLWGHNTSARLTMRPLSDEFIHAYLEAAGAEALASVGAYQLEGLGAQLFARVEGDYFTILGLPLLPLLDFLRGHGAVPE